MLKTFIKSIIGILILPFAYGVTAAFYENFNQVGDLSINYNYFIGGIVSYTILHLLFYKPTYFYVLGHEAVHAGIAWIFGGKIKSFKVSKEGGSVATDKSNLLIDLGPYFVPIYAIIIALIYFVISASYTVNTALFLFLIGFTLAFHIILTVEVMKIKQPDIVKSGYFLSIIIIYVLNIIMISAIFSLVFPAFSIKYFFTDLWHASKNVYAAVIRQLFF